MHPVEVVREVQRCFHEQDRAGAEKVFADGLVFNSPDHDHLDRATYFERCFPVRHKYSRVTLMHAVELDDHHVVSVYEYELADGSGTFRNAEVHEVRDGQVHDIQVFLGGSVRPDESREARRWREPDLS